MTPPLFTRILFATDFSADARRAQEYAIRLAGAWDAELEVLHVIEAPHEVSADAESFAMMERSRTAAAQQLEEVRDDLARPHPIRHGFFGGCTPRSRICNPSRRRLGCGAGGFACDRGAP